MGDMRLRIEDIAKLAGVSKTAVSFALNNKPGISDETRERVLTIVKEHGYVSKAQARANGIDSDSKTILLLNGSRTQITSADVGKAPFFSALVRGIEKRVNELGYHLWLRSVKFDGNFTKEIAALLSGSPVLGILLIATDLHAADVETVQKMCGNLVVIDSVFDYLDVDCFCIDNYQGAYEAAGYLMGLGHREIGYIQSAIRIFNFDGRKKGFEDGLGQGGYALDEGNTFTVSPSVEGASDDLKAQFAGRTLPTALFAENDYMAIGAIRALQSLGVDVPGHISVMGFDNIEPASLITPELTTLHVFKEKIAFAAVEKIIRNIGRADRGATKMVHTVRLIERKSCAPVSVSTD